MCILQDPAFDGIRAMPDGDQLNSGSYFLQEGHPLFTTIPLFRNHDDYLAGGSPSRDLANRHIVLSEIEDPHQLV